MRKFFLLTVMLVPLILFSQGQPAASSDGFKSAQNFYQPSGNRSIPPGTLVWSQLPNCSGSIYASQMDLVTPFDARLADDFMFDTYPGPIGAVRWWVGWWNSAVYAAPASFNIYIYDDNACIPGTVVAQWNIPFAEANEDAGCLISWPSREYWGVLDPVFEPVVDEHYWIVIQPVLAFPPQTGMLVSTTTALCPTRQNFPYIGINWATIDYYDMAFELYSYSEVPVGNWALLLGGILIAVFVFFRFRRS